MKELIWHDIKGVASIAFALSKHGVSLTKRAADRIAYELDLEGTLLLVAATIAYPTYKIVDHFSIATTAQSNQQIKTDAAIPIDHQNKNVKKQTNTSKKTECDQVHCESLHENDRHLNFTHLEF